MLAMAIIILDEESSRAAVVDYFIVHGLELIMPHSMA